MVRKLISALSYVSPLLLNLSGVGNGVSIVSGTPTLIPTATIIGDKEHKSNTQILATGESGWVPIISAGVIILIVFGISLFACCLHCPFCFIYRRGESDRII